MTQSNQKKWTPGPWSAGEFNDYVAPESGNGAICKFESKHGMYDNYVANAHLIAAAPELYEALQAAQQIIERYQEEMRMIRMKDSASVYDVCLSAAASICQNNTRKALEKARGEGSRGNELDENK